VLRVAFAPTIVVTGSIGIEPDANGGDAGQAKESE
jgi:hypothetical protein